ncbi:MAG: iron dependent repressor, metal binding and dimerization domain protein [Tissierellales bacterium]
MLSPSLEDYLEEAYRLSIFFKEIRIKDVAECLSVSMPSVVKGLRKLNKLGYIIYQPYEKIVLTDRGKITGPFLVERNRILRDFVSMIGSECDIRQEAEAMEHYLTKSTIKSIEKLVKFFTENEKLLLEFRKYEVDSVLDDKQKKE